MALVGDNWTDVSRQNFKTPEWQAFLEVPGTVSREVMGDLIRVAIGWSKRMSDEVPTDLPDSTGDHADWLAGMARLPPDKWLTIHDYQAAATKANKVLAMSSCSQRFSQGMIDGALEREKGILEGETINSYRMSAVARTFWANGFEEGLSHDKIIAGWRALQGIVDELKPTDPSE